MTEKNLTPEEVTDIRKLIALHDFIQKEGLNLTYAKIGEKFNRSEGRIRSIKYGESYANVGDQPEISFEIREKTWTKR